MNMRYHFFVSHMQVEAAGDVGTLCHTLKKLGVNCWRDMDAEDLTEEGNESGFVRDSEVFLMFLTNSLLSRPFCLKEIGWALDFDKPIVIVVETENRFWPFDLKRWQTNQCTKAPDGSWTTGWLSRTYEQCPERIRTLVESHVRKGKMLPFRRRDFELSALARKLVSRSFDVSDRIVWGEILPEPIDFRTIRRKDTRRVYLLYDDQSDVATRMAKELKSTMRTVWKRCEFVTKIEKAERATILLTGNLLSGDSLEQLIELVKSMDATQMEYIYLLDGEDSWDWGAVGRLSLDDGKIQQKVQESIWNHEAYKWRTSRELYYEHYALVVSLIGRLTWGTDEVDDTEIEIVEESSSERGRGERVVRERRREEKRVAAKRRKKRVVARKRE